MRPECGHGIAHSASSFRCLGCCGSSGGFRWTSCHRRKGSEQGGTLTTGSHAAWADRSGSKATLAKSSLQACSTLRSKGAVLGCGCGPPSLVASSWGRESKRGWSLARDYGGALSQRCIKIPPLLAPGATAARGSALPVLAATVLPRSVGLDLPPRHAQSRSPAGSRKLPNLSRRRTSPVPRSRSGFEVGRAHVDFCHAAGALAVHRSGRKAIAFAQLPAHRCVAAGAQTPSLDLPARAQ
jgi:hypothetical protein